MPVILTRSQILQGLWQDKSDWDDPVPEPLGKMEKQPTSLGETEDPEVLEATYNRKTHVFTTPPLFGGEQP